MLANKQGRPPLASVVAAVHVPERRDGAGRAVWPRSASRAPARLLGHAQRLGHIVLRDGVGGHENVALQVVEELEVVCVAKGPGAARPAQ